MRWNVDTEPIVVLQATTVRACIRDPKPLHLKLRDNLAFSWLW